MSNRNPFLTGLAKGFAKFYVAQASAGAAVGFAIPFLRLAGVI